MCVCPANAGTDGHGGKAALKRKVVAAIKETAGILGNTPAVCRSSYICPKIIDGFEMGKVIDHSFKSMDELISYRGRRLHVAEKSLLAFMKRSAPG